jgi:hypothetical protein
VRWIHRAGGQGGTHGPRRNRHRLSDDVVGPPLALTEPFANTAAKLAGLRDGGVIAVHSTVHPDTCRRLARRASARGVSVLDPVSGAPR